MRKVILDLLRMIVAFVSGGALGSFRGLMAALLAWCRDVNRPKRRTYCVPIERPEFIVPDPMIYSQYYLQSLGIPITWDNPDIRLYDQSGKEVKSDKLEAATEYTIKARVWNVSTQCPVIDMPIDFLYLQFGAGTSTHVIGTAKVDLGVKGGPNCPAYAEMKWTTPPDVGHYCVQVRLRPPDDVNWANNLGQHNFDVINAMSPARGSLALQNPYQQPETFCFEVDAYSIPDVPICGDARSGGQDYRSRHVRSAVPGNWSVSFAPDRPFLAPGEQITVQVEVVPPPGYRGEMPINIRVRAGDHLVGGVTFSVIGEQNGL